MNVLLETYIFYADIYFIQNLFMKIVVLYLSLFCMKQYLVISHLQGIMKLIGIAALGTMVETIGVLIIKPYWIFIVFIYVFLLPSMIQLLLPKGEKSFVLVFRSIFFTILINGIIQCLWNYFGNERNYISYVFFSGILVMVIVPIWSRYKQNQKGIYLVKLVHKGKEILARGYFDSGNCLKDPYSHKGVQIVSKELLEKLVPQDETKVYIPFQSLGMENGIIAVVYIDVVCIFMEKEKVLKKVPVGIAEDNLFKDKPYKLILNEGVL